MEVVEEIWASLSAVQRRLDVEIGRRDNLYAAAEELSALVARLRADVDLLIVVGAAGFSPSARALGGAVVDDITIVVIFERGLKGKGPRPT